MTWLIWIRDTVRCQYLYIDHCHQLIRERQFRISHCFGSLAGLDTKTFLFILLLLLLKNHWFAPGYQWSWLKLFSKAPQLITSISRIQEVLRNKDTLRCCFSFFKKTPTVYEKEKIEENHVASSRPGLPAAGIARKLRNRRRRHSEIRAGVLDCGGDCCSSSHTCHRSNLHQVQQSFAVYGH